jgi:O-antigen/teichoic acid export membrane protein
MSSIRRNSFYGLLGFAIPTAVLLVAYPVLVRHLGAAAFGIYILATSISGTLAFLDFGFSSATLRFVAEDVAKENREAAADVIIASLIFYGGLGALGAIGIWVISPWLVSLFSVDRAMQPDAITAFRLTAIQFGAFLLTTVFISLFKGLQRFELSTLVLSSLSALTYGGATVAVLLADIGLIGITAISLIANLTVLAFSIVVGLSLSRASGIPLAAGRPSLATFRRMFGFGAIMAVNSVAGLLLYKIQQYFVGALIGAVAVTIYVLAFTIALKAHAVVNAITEVMFPLASALQDRRRLRHVYLRMLIGSAVVALMILLPLAIFPKPIMTLWVGAELAEQVSPLLPILALACFFLSLSPAPYHVVNGIGRPGFNTWFYAINALTNVAMIGLFTLGHITVIRFAWAFAIANVTSGLMYQVAVELFIWRRGLIASQTAETLRAIG